MKYIKLYEAFKATILSKMNSYLKSSGVSERSKTKFLEDLNKIDTTINGSIKVVINNKTGFVCSKSNTELIKAISTLAESKSLRTKFGKNSKAHALKIFSEKQLISAHKELYLKLK
jgi:glycosyltransferase involved in cell wall biosynthesis